VESEFNGMKFKFTQVVNGDKGWIKINDNTDDMTTEMVAEGREQLHLSWMATLAPLVDKDVKLAPLGEVKVGDQPAVGVRVSRKHRRDVSLFFEKKTNMLVKPETRAKDIKSGKEFTAETYYGGYKEIDGVPVATKVTAKGDGKDFVNGEVTEYKRHEKLD